MNDAEGEGLSEDEVFYNQIETRLRFDEDIRDEADERLGSAYVACLAQYEYQPDAAALGESWSPLTVEHLVEHEKITREEAEVIVKMANEEYSL